MIELKGVVPPIVTPLTEQETLDGEGLKNMVRYLLEGGVHGIFVLGSTGEYPCLEDEVKWEAVKVVVEEVNGRVPVLAGVTGVGTKQTLTNLAKAQDQGVDAVVVSPGYYYPHTKGSCSITLRGFTTKPRCQLWCITSPVEFARLWS